MRVVHERWWLRVVALGAMLGLIVWVRVRLHVEAGGRSDQLIVWYGVVVTAAYLVPGIVLLVRRRWHVVGWLLCVLAVVMAFSFSSDWGGVRFGDRWMVWLLDLMEGTLFWFPFVALLVVFPDGLGARTPQQRMTGRVLIAVAFAVVIPELLVTEMAAEGGRLVPSPVGFAFLPAEVEDVTSAAAFAALAAAFVGMVRRYRASTAGTRRQYRWVLAAIAFLVVALLIGLAGSLLAGVDGVWWMPILLAYVALPVAFMVAILRYRLYEIDRLISRTVTYSVVVTLAGAAYLGAIAVLTLVLPRTSDLAVAASTLAAAAVVRPLHRRVHAAIDRRFNRPRFDAEREIRRFGRGLRDQTDLAIVEASLSDVVARTVHPASYVLWIRPP